jgi:predicted nucleic acid-binding protein
MKRATRKNERSVVGRRGEPSVVIMSVQDYMKTFAPTPEELRTMQATAKRTGAARLTAGQVNRIVAAVRREQKPKSDADNRFLECAGAAEAEFLVTGNKRHFPKRWKKTRVVNARGLLGMIGSSFLR